MCSYMANGGGRYSAVGDYYFNEFNTHFWLRPDNDLKVV